MDTFAALKAFVAVVDAGGFAPAGRRMNVATSSVTRQVDALESSLATPLLNRSTRQVTLTGAGEAYYDHVTRILSDLENANLEVSERSGPPRGQLRLSLPVAFGRLHVAPFVSEFTRRYPDISLQLMLSDEVADLVGQRLDLAIRLGHVEAPSVVARRISPHHRMLCASPDYLGERGEPRAPADLSAHNCLTFAYGAGGRTWYFSGPSETSICVDGSLQANSSEVLREAAVGGLGMILMPCWLIGADIEAGRLRSVLPAWKADVSEVGQEGGIYAVYHPTRRSSRKVRVFIDFLVECFGSPPYWDRDSGL
ncbi:LysR family transcriptional regulator [Salinicola sp. V024]|uniref:LysR family transcriptional regulator n=1 Tax=Salinicola sp. V024 TaxID=3459609 RepID=UPI00404467B8